MLYSDEELEGHLREKYKYEREGRDVKDTNIASTIGSLKRDIDLHTGKVKKC